VADAAALLAEGRRVLEVESRALAALAERLDGSFARAAELIAGARGRVIVSGIGKSGIVASKVAATLTSTGTPATFHYLCQFVKQNRPPLVFRFSIA
jgi:arabinose-5-phosphate isomerase